GRNLGLGGGKPHPQLGIQLTKELRHAIGGLQAMISPSMAIFASTMNAYRRLQSGVFAPVNTAWGYNNRNAALRIPAGEAQARRIEHRVASADANIYLSVAGVLAGIHYGLHEKLEPGEPTIGPILEGHNPAILGSWWEAIDCFEGFKPWQSYLGTQFHDRFARLQRSNLDLFLRGTHARDRALYLECL
ncbi:MAG: glutamine synthetase, partial [Pseudomonadota bacterium]